MHQNKIKFIAYYFPQFHPIKENNQWWGEGFTDWDYVKNAKSLFKEHYMPRVPLNKNYYDPTYINTIKWQVELAKSYGIDGFCFHHYWFDGKLLLEKPLELFLNEISLNISFCLSWANESWTKRWIGKNNEVLQEQKHTPDPKIWEAHFNYLLPFFKDERYLKIEDKPVFIIYQPDLLVKSNEMFGLWNELAKTKGLKGIYFIATRNHEYINSNSLQNYSGLIKFQPREAYNSKSFKNKNIFSKFQFLRSLPLPLKNMLTDLKQKVSNYELINVDEIWQSIITNATNDKNNSINIFESVFMDWDNTPRYGKKSKIFYGITPVKFESYLLKLLEVIGQRETYIFINAWNEWSECAYLEPDESYGYSFLQALKNCKDKLLINTN
jgi:hypothetical protein